MRKKLMKAGKYGLSVILVASMLATSMPVGNAVASQETDTVKVENEIQLEAPEMPSREVEVYNEDGSMKHVLMSEEEYQEAFYEYDYSESTYSEDVSSDTLNVPIMPKWNSMPAPSAGKYSFQYADLVNNGDDADNYCILIAGDGYTASEQDKFLQIAQGIANHFMSKVPFSDPDIRNKINIRAVCVTSNYSGVQENSTNPYDTFFKCTFWNNNIERLIVAHDSTRVWEIVDQYMPDCKCPIIVGNSTKYGGAGGSFCTISANENSPEIAFHEFGHTGGGLADEYWEATYGDGNRHEAPNKTANGDPNTCKWADLIGTNGVGLYAFEEAGVYDYYRPHQSCEMRYLNQQFCEVCKRHVRSVIKGVVDNAVPQNAVISNAEQLKDYCNKVAQGASTSGKTVTLASDIYLTGTNNLASMSSFKGTFDGNGHKISGININSSEGTGFIGTLEGTGVVKNLYLENVSISGGGYYTGGIVGNCKGTIYECSVSGSINGANAVGGITGHSESGANVHDNYNLASVYSSEQVSGGVVGWAQGGTVKNNYSIGKITSAMSWKGGISGYATDTTYSYNYYLSGSADYGVQGSGSADAKSSTEFSNGTITNLLNSVNNVWKQGDGHPIHSYSGQTVQEPETQVTVQEAFSKIEAENFTSKSNLIVDNNSSMSGGHNLGGVINGSYTQYDDVQFSEAASSLSIRYSSPSGIASGNVEVYVDNLDNKVGTIALPNNGTNWSTYGDTKGRLDSVISAGTHRIYLKFITTNSAYYVANVDYFSFIKANGDTTSPSGYSSLAGNWNELNYWSVYLASGWGNDPIAFYKDGDSYNSFSLKLNKASMSDWGIQLRTKELPVIAGATYKATLMFNATKASSDSFIFKDEFSGVETTYNMVSGTNTYTVEFDANSDKAQMYINLGMLPEGAEFTITSFTIVKISEDPTTQQVTTKAPETTTQQEEQKPQTQIDWDNISFVADGANGGASDNQYKFYCEDSRVEMVNIQLPGFASKAGIYVQFPAAISSTTVSSDIQGAGVVLHLDNFENKITTFTVTDAMGTYTCYVYNAKAGEVETPTEAETTTQVSGLKDGIEINGFQVSAVVGGMRTVYSVDSTINEREVVASGLIYSLEGYAEEKDMYVGSTSQYVKSFESTSQGLCSTVFSDSEIASSYAMTMRFATMEVSELTINWRVRAYAKLSDGSYVYTDVVTYSIYNISKILYNNMSMTNAGGHEYLYTNILKKVNPNHIKIEYNRNDIYVPAY